MILVFSQIGIEFYKTLRYLQIDKAGSASVASTDRPLTKVTITRMATMAKFHIGVDQHASIQYFCLSTQSGLLLQPDFSASSRGPP